jgi:hydroxymethylpyrimidine/phosphomethylpyrimidine kinase
VVVTPNVAEAEVLTQRAIRTLDDLRSAAQKLAEKYGVPFLVKGGHLRGANRAVDVLFDGTQFHQYRPMMTPKIRTHGTGCAFSAAITANLALGYGLSASIGRAKGFVTTAIQSASRLGRYRALGI